MKFTYIKKGFSITENLQAPAVKDSAKDDSATNAVDNTLVEQAYEEIFKIFTTADKAVDAAILETGEYLLKEFYDSDFEKAREKNSSKKGSLNQLIKKLQESSFGAPSKSWIYNAIGLVVQNNDLKSNSSDESFHTFGTLPVSHKIRLLSVKDLNDKTQLINEINDNNLSVRSLDKRKKELLLGKSASTDLLSLLDFPDKLFDDKHENMRSLEALKKLSDEERNAIKTNTLEKAKILEKDVAALNKKLKKQDDLIKKYNQLSKTIEQAMQ